jgi:glucokinase
LTNLMSSTCAIGLDVGGTKISGGVVSLPSGEVLVKRVIPTRAEREGQLVLSDALALARRLMEEASALRHEILGIGVGVAELVDLEGNVTSGQTIHWNGLPVQERFSEVGPAVVESDVRAAALAESLFGAGKSFPIVVYVTVGTGISYSLVNEGRPFTGARGNALILSSSPLTTRCIHCGQLLKPVLEEFASGPALVSRYNQKASSSVARAEEVLAAVEVDPMAVEVVRTAGEALGVSVAFLVNTLDPQAVIVGGGLGLAGGLYWSSFVSSAREHIWAEASRNLPILKAALGTDAGLVGAAATVVLRKHPGQFRGQCAKVEGEEEIPL